MKKQTKVLLGAATVAAAMAGAAPAQAASTGVAISAEIIAAVAIAPTTALTFGTIESPTASGTVSVNTAGTAGGSLTVAAGTPQPGGFTVTAANGFNVKVSVPTKVQITAGTQKMSVTSFEIDTGAGAGSENYILAANGAAQTLKIGGTLKVAAGQAAGSYSGSVTVTADYQ